MSGSGSVSGDLSSLVQALVVTLGAWQRVLAGREGSAPVEGSVKLIKEWARCLTKSLEDFGNR